MKQKIEGGKKPRIRVTAVNEKVDGKQAKFMEAFLNHEYKRYKDIIDAITLARRYVEMGYGLQTPDSIWDRIATEVVKFDIKNMEKPK
jgi:hypothetical protein